MSTAVKLTRAERIQVEAAAEVFRPWGLQHTVEMGGKHLTMRIDIPNVGVWRLTIACTPRSADNAVDITRQKAKRLVRDINDRLGIYRMGI